ncbi:hypothetical protein [Streptomyces sp. NBC_00069]|uniref:hypothetical protein n=1 Tax=Streptomyces sp. NBC_00069 TaxID=2975639 RepID=UPI0032501D74
MTTIADEQPEQGQHSGAQGAGTAAASMTRGNSSGPLSARQQELLKSGGYRLLAYGDLGAAFPCGRESTTGTCRRCHPKQDDTDSGRGDGTVPAELVMVLRDKAPQVGPGVRTMVDRFGFLDFDAVAALLSAQTATGETRAAVRDHFERVAAKWPGRLGQIMLAADRATDGLVSELLSVPWPQSSTVTSGPITLRCQLREAGTTREDFQTTITYQQPADTSSTHPDTDGTAGTASAVDGRVTLATFEAVEDMSQMPAWFGYGTPTITPLPDLPGDTPVVALPLQGQFDELFKEVITAEIGGDRNIAELVYASLIWAISATWCAFEGICETHIQECCAPGNLCVAIDYALEDHSVPDPDAVLALARAAVGSYRHPHARYMHITTALTAQNFVRRITARAPRNHGTAARPVTPAEFLRCRWYDGSFYAWLSNIEQARASEAGPLHDTVERAMGQCASAIAAYDLIGRTNDLTDVWTDASEGETFNELLQAVRFGYRGSFVPYARAMTASVSASCACTCPYGFHTDAADMGLGLVVCLVLFPRYNALADYALYCSSLPDLRATIDVFVCRAVPADLDRMVFTPNWQLMDWVAGLEGDDDSLEPPAGSKERAPRQWADRIVDFRRDHTAHDAVRHLLAQGPQAPSAYCAKDRVLRVLATAAPQAEPAALGDAAALVADLWDLVVELRQGNTAPDTAARASSHLTVRIDRLVYTAVRGHPHPTAVALQRATIGYLTCIIQLTGCQLYEVLVAHPHIRRHIALWQA